MFTVQQFDSAVQKFLDQNSRDAVRYNSASLAKTISDRMQQAGLPTAISARIMFDALVREGKIVRTDGHDSAWDAEQDALIREQLVADVIAKDQAEPLHQWEAEWFASMSPKEVSERYYENGGLSKFRFRYDLAIAQGFKQPMQYTDKVQS